MNNYWEGFICPVCGEGFTLKQWDNRHNGENGEEYHADCCPECKDITDEDGDFYHDDDDDDADDYKYDSYYDKYDFH